MRQDERERDAAGRQDSQEAVDRKSRTFCEQRQQQCQHERDGHHSEAWQHASQDGDHRAEQRDMREGFSEARHALPNGDAAQRAGHARQQNRRAQGVPKERIEQQGEHEIFDDKKNYRCLFVWCRCAYSA